MYGVCICVRCMYVCVWCDVVVWCLCVHACVLAPLGGQSYTINSFISFFYLTTMVADIYVRVSMAMYAQVSCVVSEFA